MNTGEYGVGFWEFILFAVVLFAVIFLIAWFRKSIRTRKRRKLEQSMTQEELREYYTQLHRKEVGDETIRTEFAAMKAMEHPQGFDNGGVGSR